MINFEKMKLQLKASGQAVHQGLQDYIGGPQTQRLHTYNDLQ
jgi:hypothetical protein